MPYARLAPYIPTLHGSRSSVARGRRELIRIAFDARQRDQMVEQFDGKRQRRRPIAARRPGQHPPVEHGVDAASLVCDPPHTGFYRLELPTGGPRRGTAQLFHWNAT